jgi:hypothetical protein
MSSAKHMLRRVRGGIAGPLAAATVVLSLTAVSAAAQVGPTPSSPAAAQECVGGSPFLQLANPSPGDRLLAGDYVVSGSASQGTGAADQGVSRVDLFLGHRESGGIFLGSAVPGQNDSTFAIGSQLALTGFTITTTLPSSANGAQDFVAYAYSATDGQETSQSVPITIGVQPVATPQSSSNPATVPLVSTTLRTVCSLQAVIQPAQPVAQASGTPVAQAIGTPAALVTSLQQQPPVLSIANPSPGDVLQSGDVIIEGVAYDPASIQGPGVDRVVLFLDDRDQGGMFLGSAMPGEINDARVAQTGTQLDQVGFAIRVTLPDTMRGGHTLFAYAHSSMTGKDVMVSIPVFVGAAPTPTPRPS